MESSSSPKPPARSWNLGQEEQLPKERKYYAHALGNWCNWFLNDILLKNIRKFRSDPWLKPHIGYPWTFGIINKPFDPVMLRSMLSEPYFPLRRLASGIQIFQIKSTSSIHWHVHSANIFWTLITDKAPKNGDFFLFSFLLEHGVIKCQNKRNCLAKIVGSPCSEEIDHMPGNYRRPAAKISLRALQRVWGRLGVTCGCEQSNPQPGNCRTCFFVSWS